MSNSEKIKILKENIKNYITNNQDIDENTIFTFAKQQSKEMRIEITKGEIKSIVYEILAITNSNLNADDTSLNNSAPLLYKNFEDEDPFLLT